MIVKHLSHSRSPYHRILPFQKTEKRSISQKYQKLISWLQSNLESSAWRTQHWWTLHRLEDFALMPALKHPVVRKWRTSSILFPTEIGTFNSGLTNNKRQTNSPPIHTYRQYCQNTLRNHNRLQSENRSSTALTGTTNTSISNTFYAFCSGPHLWIQTVLKIKEGSNDGSPRRNGHQAEVSIARPGKPQNNTPAPNTARTLLKTASKKAFGKYQKGKQRIPPQEIAYV